MKFFSRTQITIAIILGITGLLLVTQFRGQSTFSNNLQAQTTRDLGEVIKNLNLEVEALQRDVANNTIQLYQYDQAATNKKLILEEALKNLETLKIAAGLTKVEGKGIVIQISDQGNLLGNHDLLDIIQELRSVGAEAISINGQRIVAESPLDQERNLIKVNKVKLTTPYQIRAIGDPEILYQAITILGGVRDTLSSLKGVSLEIIKKQRIIIPPLRRIPKRSHAKPIAALP